MSCMGVNFSGCNFDPYGYERGDDGITRIRHSASVTRVEHEFLERIRSQQEDLNRPGGRPTSVPTPQLPRIDVRTWESWSEEDMKKIKHTND